MKAKIMKCEDGYDVVFENGYIIPFSEGCAPSQIKDHIERRGVHFYLGSKDYDKVEYTEELGEIDVECDVE